MVLKTRAAAVAAAAAAPACIARMLCCAALCGEAAWLAHRAGSTSRQRSSGCAQTQKSRQSRGCGSGRRPGVGRGWRWGLVCAFVCGCGLWQAKLQTLQGLTNAASATSSASQGGRTRICLIPPPEYASMASTTQGSSPHRTCGGTSWWRCPTGPGRRRRRGSPPGCSPRASCPSRRTPPRSCTGPGQGEVCVWGGGVSVSGAGLEAEGGLQYEPCSQLLKGGAGGLLTAGACAPSHSPPPHTPHTTSSPPTPTPPTYPPPPPPGSLSGDDPVKVVEGAVQREHPHRAVAQPPAGDSGAATAGDKTSGNSAAQHRPCRQPPPPNPLHPIFWGMLQFKRGQLESSLVGERRAVQNARPTKGAAAAPQHCSWERELLTGGSGSCAHGGCLQGSPQRNTASAGP